jgi:hypothetical protein
MPYTEQVKRLKVQNMLDELSKLELTPGEFNFFITCLAIQQAGDHPNYEKLRGVLGDYFASALEFYRRTVVPYEDMKLYKNGDVGYIITEKCGCSSKSTYGLIEQVNVCDQHKSDYQAFLVGTGLAKPIDFVRPDAGSPTSRTIKHHSGCTNPYCVGCVD